MFHILCSCHPWIRPNNCCHLDCEPWSSHAIYCRAILQFASNHHLSIFLFQLLLFDHLYWDILCNCIYHTLSLCILSLFWRRKSFRNLSRYWALPAQGTEFRESWQLLRLWITTESVVSRFCKKALNLNYLLTFFMSTTCCWVDIRKRDEFIQNIVKFCSILINYQQIVNKITKGLWVILWQFVSRIFFDCIRSFNIRNLHAKFFLCQEFVCNNAERPYIHRNYGFSNSSCSIEA